MYKLGVGRFRNCVFLGTLVFILIFLFITMVQANQQNYHFSEQHMRFLQMTELGNQGNYEEVIKQYDNLAPGFADNFQPLLAVGYAYASLNNLDKAKYYLNKAKINAPQLEEDPDFLLLYGNILYLKKDNLNAEKYIKRCLDNNPTSKTRNQAETLLSEIKI